MDLNWVVIAIGAIFLISVIVGICKGAIRIAVSLATTLVTLLAVFFAAPYVSDMVGKYTPIDEMMEEKMGEVVMGAAADYFAEEGVDVLGDQETSPEGETSLEGGVLPEGMEIPRELQQEAIKAADMPEIFRELLLVNNNDEIYKELGVKSFAQYVGKYLGALIINIVSFLGIFLIISIILRAIIFALDIIEDLPLLGLANRLAGGAVGFACALLIVWVLFVVVTLLYAIPTGREVYQTIQGNGVLKMLYDCNPIMKLAAKAP